MSYFRKIGFRSYLIQFLYNSLVAKDARSVQDNLLKLQRDREFLQDVVSRSMTEIAATGTFTSLSSCLRECHEEKINMEQTILKYVLFKLDISAPS